MTTAQDVKRVALARRCEMEQGCDNALDVLIEVALFAPDDKFRAIRANTAGSKVICTTVDGSEMTFWAWDWTMDRPGTAALLRAHLSAQPQGETNNG